MSVRVGIDGRLARVHARDAATRVRVTSSTFDPSIGWFSGARTQALERLPSVRTAGARLLTTADSGAIEITFVAGHPPLAPAGRPRLS